MLLLMVGISFVPNVSAACVETGPTYGVNPNDCKKIIDPSDDPVGETIRLVNCVIDTLQGQECE